MMNFFKNKDDVNKYLLDSLPQFLSGELTLLANLPSNCVNKKQINK